MKKYLCLCLLLWPLSAQAQSDDTVISQAESLPIRTQRPHSVTIGGLWPRGLGLEYQYQINPTWGVGGHIGAALFYGNAGLFSRWYQSEEPSAWYWEALINSSLLGGGGAYTYNTPSISANGLIGWEHRSQEGFTIRVGTGLGLSTYSTPGSISPGLMIQLNLDAAIGYAF